MRRTGASCIRGGAAVGRGHGAPARRRRWPSAMQPGSSSSRPSTRPRAAHGRRAGAFVVHSGVLEGGIAVSLVLASEALLGLPFDGPFLLAAFCGTAAVYGLDRVVGAAEEDAVNRPARAAWWHGRRRMPAAFALAALACLPWLETATLGAGAVLAALALGYVLPLLPGGRRLKDVAVAKPLAIGAGWGAGAVLLPAVESGGALTAAAGVLLLVRTLTVFANALLTDWPDRRGDADAGLATFALRWPWDRLRWTATAVLALALVGEGMLAALPGVPVLVAVDAVAVALPLVIAWAVSPERRAYALLLDLAVAAPLVTALVAAW